MTASVRAASSLRDPLRTAALAALVAACQPRTPRPTYDPTRFPELRDLSSYRDRVHVRSTDLQIGASAAPVTIVLFADFQCDAAARSWRSVSDLLDRHGDEVRLVVKPIKLPGFLHSRIVAGGAVAARQQGRLRQMMDLVFSSDGELDRLSLFGYAGRLGLNPMWFLADMGSTETEKLIESSEEDARRLGVVSSPVWFVNGVHFHGYKTTDELEAIIEAELPWARGLMARGLPAEHLYDVITELGNGTDRSPPRVPDRLDSTKRYRVPVAPSDPQRGGIHARVTAVVFADITEKHSQAFIERWPDLERRYGRDLRLVWKHRPLSNRRGSQLAHQALFGAHQQGRFWEFAVGIIASSTPVGRDRLFELAAEAGLDVAHFARDLDGRAAIERLAADDRVAFDLDVRGAPLVFINGRPIRGLQSSSTYAAVIDEELSRARAVLAEMSPADAYEMLTHGGLPYAAQPQSDLERELGSLRVPVGADDPHLGPDLARVTITTFMDFECPFSGEVARESRRIQESRPDQVRLVFKHLPLPMHPNARRAHAMSLAAFRLGKFWQMHDWLFSHQESLHEDYLEEAARAVGVEPAILASAAASPTTDDALRAAEDYALSQGLEYTPLVVVNNRVLPASRGVEAIEALVLLELERRQSTEIDGRHENAYR